MKIETKKIENNGFGIIESILIIDGKEEPGLILTNDCMFIDEQKDVDKILKITPEEITPFVNEINFQIYDFDFDLSSEIFPYARVFLKADMIGPIYAPLIGISLFINERNWNNGYTINTFRQCYENAIKEKDGIQLLDEHNLHSDQIGGFSFVINEQNLSLSLIISKAKNTLRELEAHVKNSIAEVAQGDLLTTFFEFPDNLKIPCKQYLVYFSQFLSDIGINANTSITEEANKILFKVIPKDENQALDRIKEALELYMNAPGRPEVEIVSNEPKDIAVLQWEANIFHLKSQIALQHAVLQTKDATIEALQLSNYRLKEEVITARNIEEKNSGLKEEKFMGGVVAVKKYEGKGFSIDWPGLIRKLKRKK